MDETKDPIQQLTDEIKDIAKQISDYKTEQEKVKEEMAAYKEAAKKGFPIPTPDPEATTDELKEILAPYDLARQGKSLTDRIAHPNYSISEEKREELAKYFLLVMKAGYKLDPKARDKFRELYGDVDPEMKTAIGDTGNVFPIPDIVMEEILHFARESSVVLQYARVVPMVSEVHSWPIEGDAVSVAWGNTTEESEPGISEVELTAKELSAYSVVKNMTLADARSDIVSWLTEAMAEAAGLELDNQGFNGDGTKICSGILTAKCGYSVILGSGSTAFSQISAAKLSEMIAKLDGLKKRGARFWMHGEILHYVRSLKDTNDRPIFIETVGAPVSGTIWGYPYTEVVKMPSTSAANTAFMAFGNLRYLMVGRRLSTGALSIDPYGLWTTNRTRFKLYQRWGMKLALPKGMVRLLTHA